MLLCARPMRAFPFDLSDVDYYLHLCLPLVLQRGYLLFARDYDYDDFDDYDGSDLAVVLSTFGSFVVVDYD